ncbi:hypothetical protein [Archangium lipolyticum]|uniref:hypothetical protein n=1 Tax=Archangium lipolyticum TaxID=2970465 RepID=UPI002149F36A|nr:hypothetical protein [Archangium lipolyticum]
MHTRLLRLLAVFLCLTVAGTGCIVNNIDGDNDGGNDGGNNGGNDGGTGHEQMPMPGDVSFLWSFSLPGSLSGRCADVPDVKRVRISIPGKTLADGGISPCNIEGVDGTVLRDFAPGIYNYAIEALGSTDQVLYAGSGSFTVDGHAQVSATLTPSIRPPGPGDITFLWTFAGSGSTSGRCVDVPDVKSVRVSIAGQTGELVGTHPCNTAGVDGITLRDFAPGTYFYLLEALGSSGQVLYKAGGSVTLKDIARVNVTLQPTPPPGSGDITFLWTFSDTASGRCADVPDVKSVRITIPGQVLANDGIFACNNSGVDGIALLSFVSGTYSYTLEALGSSGQVLYKGSGSVTVNGNVRVNVTLAPYGSPSSYAYLSWSFPANSTSQNPTCAQAGVVSVDARIDGGDTVRLECSRGMSGAGVQTPFLEPGRHTLELIGVGSDGQPSYYVNAFLDIQQGSPVSASYRFGAVGGMALSWSLVDGIESRTCSQSGVTRVAINLQDEATGVLIYGTDGDPHGCEDVPVIYRFLRPGSYRVFIRGTGPGVLYTNENDSPLTLTVTAFQQKTGADAVVVALKRQ